MATIDEVFQHLRDNPTPITDFEYTEYEDYVTLDDYIGSSTEVYIPSEINEKEVRISNEARLNNTIITVIISDNIKNIYSFLTNCNNLENLSIPCSTQYNWVTFNTPGNIKNIIISKGTGTMISYLNNTTHTDYDMGYNYTPWYQNQETIENIKLEEGIEAIGNSAFYGSTLFTEIDFSVLGTKTIGSYAFYLSNIEKIKFNNLTNHIGHDAFAASNLTEIDFNNISTLVNPNIFNNCHNLIEINIPGTIREISQSCFKYCTNLSKVNIEEGVEKLGAGCFSNCEKLSIVNLPSSLTTLERYVFSGCNSLVEIIIPEKVTSLIYTFEYCNNLKKLTVLSPNCSVTNSTSGTPSNLSIYGHISFAEEAKKYPNSTFTLINLQSNSPIEERPADIEGGIPSAKLFKFGLNLGNDNIVNSQIGFVITVDNNPTIDNLVVPGSNGEITSISTNSLIEITEPIIKTFSIVNYKIENQILYTNAAITNVPEDPGYIHVTAYINQDNQGYYYTDILTYPASE